MKLDLADGFALPVDAATRRLAILAMSGAGKSNVAVVMAEQMLAAHIPWVAIDPKGDWFGIRSDVHGKGPGLPVPIFGGLHGDIPLEATAGQVIGDLIVDQRLTCVIDISEFADRQSMWRFLIDLGETLLRRNRQVLHLFLEEADEYLPQRTAEKGNLPKCLGVWQRVVKRGRFRGIGTTQITQRNAALNKDTLYQAEALIALRASGKGDRDAVKGWVEYHNASDEIVASLPSLADGEGWVSSPAWLKVTKRVQFHRRRTFDSGATPVLLKGVAKPATLADIDLATLQSRMAATIERVKADDPKELRKQLLAVQREAADLRRQKPAPAPVAQIKEVAVVKAADLRRLEHAIDSFKTVSEKAVAAQTTALERVSAGVQAMSEALGRAAIEGRLAPLVMPRDTTAKSLGGRVTPSRLVTPRRPTVQAESDGSHRLGKAERAVLAVLAQHPDGCTARKLTRLTRYRWTGGFRNVLSALRSAGYIAGGNTETLQVTKEGIDAVGDVDPLPTGAALAQYWLQHQSFGQMERAVLEELLKYPDGRTADQLCEATDYEYSGGFRNALSSLRTAGVLVGKNTETMRAAEELFD